MRNGAAPLVFESFNGSCLSTLKRRLEVSDAHFVFAQEHGITSELKGDMDAWSSQRGWKFLYSPAFSCKVGKTSYGVAVFVRLEFGLRWPDEGCGELISGKLIHSVIDIPAWPPLHCCCCCLHTGTGLKANNWKMLRALGQAASQDLFVAATEWNVAPAVVESSTLPRPLGASIVARWQAA